ncbi:MAG: hypothetical protein JW846_11510 [Dehalococcoidia bacterium]|nr:hypothetical protein [Dehalococcoidia bacterium]
MKRWILLAGLIVLTVTVLMMTISVLGTVGNHESARIPPDPFTTTWSSGRDGRTYSISGDSAGHAACKPSEFQLTLDNSSGDDSWRGSYCILLVDREETVKEIAHEQFDVPVGQTLQKLVSVTFPSDVVKGPIGLCVVIPQRGATVTTLWVGEKRTGFVEPWHAMTNCPYYLTEEGSRELAADFVRNSPTFVFDGIEESLELEETLCLLKEHKPGSPETLSNVHGWRFSFAFDSRQDGYGDRSGQTLTQVVTPHRAIIMVEFGEVTSAIMDETWDMIGQQRIDLKIPGGNT